MAIGQGSLEGRAISRSGHGTSPHVTITMLDLFRVIRFCIGRTLSRDREEGIGAGGVCGSRRNCHVL
jgi:hypothetical protein